MAAFSLIVIHPAAQTGEDPARLQGFCVLHGVGGGNRTRATCNPSQGQIQR